MMCARGTTHAPERAPNLMLRRTRARGLGAGQRGRRLFWHDLPAPPAHDLPGHAPAAAGRTVHPARVRLQAAPERAGGGRGCAPDGNAAGRHASTQGGCTVCHPGILSEQIGRQRYLWTWAASEPCNASSTAERGSRDGGILLQGTLLCNKTQRLSVLLIQGISGGATAANHTEARSSQANQAKRKEEVGPSQAARSQRTHG